MGRGSTTACLCAQISIYFFEDAPSNKLILCIDMDSDFISEKEGIALFKDGNPTELAQNAMQACADYHKFY